jgi:DNA-binding MarR family transcriptional regulator
MSRVDVPPLIGALLRLPSQAIHRRVIAGLNRDGFTDLRPPHMPAFLYPGAEGARPGELAERAGMSKQAMNQLLQSLERLGYIRRGDAAHEDGRARIVHYTERGTAAYNQIVENLVEVEHEWRETLGDERFNQLKDLLADVWVSDLVR